MRSLLLWMGSHHWPSASPRVQGHMPVCLSPRIDHFEWNWECSWLGHKYGLGRAMWVLGVFTAGSVVLLCLPTSLPTLLTVGCEGRLVYLLVLVLNSPLPCLSSFSLIHVIFEELKFEILYWNTWIANILSCSMNCHFTLLIVSFGVWNLFSLLQS